MLRRDGLLSVIYIHVLCRIIPSLYSVKMKVDALGGRLRVYDNQDEGTIFEYKSTFYCSHRRVLKIARAIHEKRRVVASVLSFEQDHTPALQRYVGQRR